MPYLLDILYLVAPLSVVLLLEQIGIGDRLGVTALFLLALASIYPIYAMVVAIVSLATRRRTGTTGRAIRALVGREAWLLWLFSPLVAAYCLLIDLLRKYVTPRFYHRPVDLMLLEPRRCPATAPSWDVPARPSDRR